MRAWQIKPLHSMLFLTVIYLVGIAGMWLAPDSFISLTPLNLALTTFILLMYYPVRDKNFIRYIIFLFAAGFSVEMLGVQTGKIFGSYYYGYALGFKLKHVPLIIGLNWVMLILATHSIANKWSQKLYVVASFGAALMVLIDLLIEPVAAQYHFWHWQNDEIPLQNYIAWFVISFFFHGLGTVLKFNKENPLAVFIFVIQLLFFLSLNLLNLFNS